MLDVQGRGKCRSDIWEGDPVRGRRTMRYNGLVRSNGGCVFIEGKK